MTQTSPGRIGLTKIHGAAGKGIRVGQFLNGSGFEDYEHAFLDLGDGTLIQAEPGGAQIRSLDIYPEGDVYWCDGIYSTVSTAKRLEIASHARTMEHVPYSFLDYFALFTHRLHIPAPGLRRYIASSGHLICSQLVDRAYMLSCVHLFQNRWEGYVTPGDLYRLDKLQTPRIDSIPCGFCGSLSYCQACLGVS